MLTATKGALRPLPEDTKQTSAPAKHPPTAQGGALPPSPVREPAVGAHGPPPRQYRGRRDLTNGSIPNTLFHLSWPQVTEGALNVADQMVDLIWAGLLPGGYKALAGVGVSQAFVQFGFMTRQGLDMALRAMVSRAVGAGDIALANRIVLQAFSLTFIFGMLMILVGVFLTEVLIGMIGASEAVKAQTALYMRYQFIGMMSMSFRMATGAALQSTGDVMTPLKATTATRISHVILTPFLMFGWLAFPTMGLAGAGLANVLAQGVGASINFYALFKGTSSLKLTLRGYRPDWEIIRRMFVLGAPATIAGTERAVAQLVLLRLVTPFGDIATAAYAMTRRMEMFANFASMGFGQAAGIMVGQNLGAGKPDRAKKAVYWALGFVSVEKAVVGAFLFVFPALFVMLFTRDAEVVSLASAWVRIQVIAAVFMGLSMVYQQSYNTAGDTWAPMIVTLITVWFIELPIAWLLTQTLHIGPLGIAFAAIAGMGGRLLFYVPYFYWGRWLRIKVI